MAKIKVELESGYCCELEEKVLDNMELLERLVEVEEGKPASMISALDMLLGQEQRMALYDHLRTDDGRVPIRAAARVMVEIIRGARGKNS